MVDTSSSRNADDLEDQAAEVVDAEETHRAETIDRPPDEDQDIRKSKVYKPYDLAVVLILAPASILGVLGRLGTSSLTTYDGSSVFALAYVQGIGCLVMGFGLSLKEPLGRYYGPFYTAITTGFCGSFTTFSGWQLDIFNSWINASDYRRGGLRDVSFPIPPLRHELTHVQFINGIGISTITLSLSLASISFGATLGQLAEPYLKFPRFPPKWQRYSITVISALVYGASIVTFFLLSDSFRHQATAALIFSYPGTLTRYFLSTVLNPRYRALPSGTLAANILGTALLAAFQVLQNVNSPVSPYACTVLQGLKDGYCGCLTTVSTFAAEVRDLGRWKACRYVVVSWVLGQLMMLLILGPSYWTGHAQERITCRFQ
ncbi:CrcB-like protein-domain-containing protein [Ephemerocybe angulata]|uniref:CrcB-like protein-domain-containing protein n=1 Tax=Ephemerocybe angulata TaxID=980116 RepID=A0A8H6MAT3_9AGAR|nr:CrcB-like protein-domain-containing protein [Tulosesus angulatus]